MEIPRNLIYKSSAKVAQTYAVFRINAERKILSHPSDLLFYKNENNYSAGKVSKTGNSVPTRAATLVLTNYEPRTGQLKTQTRGGEGGGQG